MYERLRHMFKLFKKNPMEKFLNFPFSRMTPASNSSTSIMNTNKNIVVYGHTPLMQAAEFGKADTYKLQLIFMRIFL
jgi:hypothetical protein